MYEPTHWIPYLTSDMFKNTKETFSSAKKETKYYRQQNFKRLNLCGFQKTEHKLVNDSVMIGGEFIRDLTPHHNQQLN